MRIDDMVQWAPDLARQYRLGGCWRGRPLGDYLWDHADRWGPRIALVDGDRTLTYRELAGRADNLAGHLAALGLTRGDRVLLQVPTGWELMVVTFACWRLGVVPVMMSMPHREYEFAAVAAHVDAAAVIVTERWRGFDHQAMAHRVITTLPASARVLVLGDRVRPGGVNLRALLADGDDATTRHRWLDDIAPDSSDLALMLLCGASGGMPRVVAHTHDDYEYAVRCCAEAGAFDSDTVHLGVLPAGHFLALAPGILATLHSGGRAVLTASTRPEVVFEAIAAHGVTVTATLPQVAVRWLEQRTFSRRNLSSLRF
ncbi:AMP-binding protein, partial [Winogradskya consettensis]